MQVFGEARTRILVWYVILMAVSGVVSILVIRNIALLRLEEQVQQSLLQEVEEFRQLTSGRNPRTGQPFGDDVAAIFKVFLSRNIPEHDEFLLTILNGRFYESSPKVLPDVLKPNSVLVNHWSRLTIPEQSSEVAQLGTFPDIAQLAQLRYKAEPIIITGKVRGVFVVAHLVSNERDEVNEFTLTTIGVTAIVLLIASVFAWFAAGEVLTPLRLLSQTARSISESDLTQRIPVRGRGEMAELTKTFNEMMERLQQSFDNQRDFLSDVSHELRTPITIVQGHLEVMGDDPQEQRETIELVIDELDRMNRFVSELSLLAKTSRPDFLKTETLAIAPFTEEIYAKAVALANRSWYLEGTATGQIVADRQRLTQALMNLTQNAVQHTQVGDIIALGSTVKDGEVRFWVRDTGEGIVIADQQQIFERFVRGSRQSFRAEGTGLGLSIVRAIVQAHGGRIELQSQPSAGSTFTIAIALAP